MISSRKSWKSSQVKKVKWSHFQVIESFKSSCDYSKYEVTTLREICSVNGVQALTDLQYVAYTVLQNLGYIIVEPIMNWVRLVKKNGPTSMSDVHCDLC